MMYCFLTPYNSENVPETKMFPFPWDEPEADLPVIDGKTYLQQIEESKQRWAQIDQLTLIAK